MKAVTFAPFVMVLASLIEEAGALGRETVNIPISEAKRFIELYNEEAREGADPADTTTGGGTTDATAETISAGEGTDTIAAGEADGSVKEPAPRGGAIPADLVEIVNSETGAIATGVSVATSALNQMTVGLNRLRTAHGLPEVK